MMKNMLVEKKGQTAFTMLGSMAVGIATLAITLTVTFLILAEGKDQAAVLDCDNVSDITTCGNSFNGTAELQSAVDDIPGWVPLIVIAGVGSVLLGLVALFRSR